MHDRRSSAPAAPSHPLAARQTGRSRPGPLATARAAAARHARLVAAGALLAAGCGGGGAGASEGGDELTAGGEARGGEGCHAHGGHPHGEAPAGGAGHGEHAAHGRGHDDFSDVECFARMFDAPERDAWQRPDDVVALLEISPGMTVADLGAGTGYFEARLDSAVGEGGHVLALDVEPAMVEHMRARFEREGLSRSEARVVAPDDPGLGPASVDRVLVVDTWHHVADRPAYAALLFTALRPGGAVLVVDFTMESPEGPPPSMRLEAAACAAELAGAGLATEIVAEALPHQWVVRGRRPAE